MTTIKQIATLSCTTIHGLATNLGLATLALGLLAVPVEATEHAAEESAPAAFTESDFLKRSRRLIFDGKRSGEGYFSPDGKQMVFQSERIDDNPFYQIFLMDMETGDVTQVSNGTGKTTCAFIEPGNGHVLFSSTHHDPESARLQKEELDFRASGAERRYSWDYDPQMDLYIVDPATSNERRLTTALGYDAEASYSPDGKWVVFSSMRDGYDGELTAEEKKILEVDPSYFGELYRIRTDGTGLERLTSVPGYDGGPFYFPNGERIIWRRFSEDGLTANVWSMKADGSDQRQLTDFGAMSWAPYVHPSGEYILFASNKHGFSNFEVFMIDVAGTKEPVRITNTDDFDGLPVPTPDGKQLVWTSSRHAGKGAQLYVAQWSHETAMKALAAAPLRGMTEEGSR